MKDSKCDVTLNLKSSEKFYNRGYLGIFFYYS